jgi:hypothetical protein
MEDFAEFSAKPQLRLRLDPPFGDQERAASLEVVYPAL